MVDINNEEYLARLHKAVATDDGQIIIEFIKHEAKQFDYEHIVHDKTFAELGRKFKLFQEINEFIKNLLSKLGERL